MEKVKYQVYLSNNAFLDILLELQRHKRVETGGILVGRQIENNFYIQESTDSGKKAKHQATMFERDYEYCDHLANTLLLKYNIPGSEKRLYQWHRHPDGFDRFSHGDKASNIGFAKLYGGCVAALVLVDPEFRLLFFFIDEGGRYKPVDYEINDEAVQKAMPLKRCEEVKKYIEIAERELVMQQKNEHQKKSWGKGVDTSPPQEEEEQNEEHTLIEEEDKSNAEVQEQEKKTSNSGSASKGTVFNLYGDVMRLVFNGVCSLFKHKKKDNHKKLGG